jgi:thiol-disulfide isomerase/thioredoxin
LLVVCLCAHWCGTCRDYQAVFVGAQGRFQALARFDQIDIEDEAELLDDVEIENFPTLLIARGERVLFFGTITPDAQTLARLIAGAHAGALDPPASPPPILALARRVTARAQFRRG